jgi:hypothetical protein
MDAAKDKKEAPKAKYVFVCRSFFDHGMLFPFFGHHTNA